MPASITPTSTGCSANATNAIAVIASKNEMGCGWRESIKSKYSSISLYVAIICAGVIGEPLILIRSVKDSRCGDV